MKQVSLLAGILGALCVLTGAIRIDTAAAAALRRSGPQSQRAAPTNGETSIKRSLRGTFRERPPAAKKVKELDFRTWENVALAVPPNSGSCGSEGMLLVASDGLYGPEPQVWRGSLKCTTSNVLQCPLSPVTYGTSNWPAVNVAGFSDDIPGAADKQLVRFADGTLLLVHQGIRRDAGTTASCVSSEGTCRGAEYCFHSSDCGANWTLASVLDPASDGPVAEPDRYYDHRTQHGHDRPELCVDPFNPGRVYMTVIGWGDEFGTIVLFRSDDRGVTWRFAAELPQIWWGAYMVTLPSGRLYVASYFGAGPPHNFGLVSYDPATGAVTGPVSVGADLQRPPVTRMAAGCEGISRVGTLPDGDYVRMHCTYRTGAGDFGLVVRVVRISESTTDVVSEYRYVPPTGSSVVGPSVIAPDMLEWQPGGRAEPALIYWYEPRTVGNNGDFGPARVVGQRFDGSVPGNVFCLSPDVASCRSWTIFTDVYGDYQKGAFWYDRKKRQLGYLALWAEQDSIGNGSVRTNFLTLVEPRRRLN